MRAHPPLTYVRAHHPLSCKEGTTCCSPGENANSVFLQKLMCKHIVIGPDDVQDYSLLYFLITQAQLTNLDFD